MERTNKVAKMTDSSVRLQTQSHKANSLTLPPEFDAHAGEPGDDASSVTQSLSVG